MYASLSDGNSAEPPVLLSLRLFRLLLLVNDKTEMAVIVLLSFSTLYICATFGPAGMEAGQSYSGLLCCLRAITSPQEVALS